MGRSELKPGDRLNVGESLVSPDGRTVLTLVANLFGNSTPGGLRLTVDNNPAWSNYATGIPEYMSLESTGNLVIYNNNNESIWTTKVISVISIFIHQFNFVVQNDNNAVIYANGSSPLWATDTPKVTRFRKCSFVNNAVPLCWPAIRDIKGGIAWTGKDDNAFWSIIKGGSHPVDFGTDRDSASGNGKQIKEHVQGRAMNIGMERSGDEPNPFVYDRVFLYDDNCDDIWRFVVDGNGNISCGLFKPQTD